MRSVCSVGPGRDRTRRTLGSDGPLALLHVGTTVALVSGDGAGTLSTRAGVRKGAGALQLSKDRVLVCKQVTHKAVAVAFVHAQSRLLSWTEYARRKYVGQGRNISLIRRGKLNETSEVGADCI